MPIEQSTGNTAPEPSGNAASSEAGQSNVSFTGMSSSNATEAQQTYEFYGFAYVFPDEVVVVNENDTITRYYEGPDGNAHDNPEVKLYEHGKLIDRLPLEPPQNPIPAREAFLNSPKK